MLLGVLAVLLGGLWGYGSWQVGRAEVRFPPRGEVLTVEGVQLRYVCAGAGRPVLLLHGNAGFLEDYTLTVLDQLAQNYRACAFDRPGHGYSSRPDPDAPPAVQARLLHQAAQQLGMDKPLLVGHSWSGALNLAYALDYPDEVSGLVLLAPIAYGQDRRPSLLTQIQQVPVLGTLVRHTLGVPLGRAQIEQSLIAAFAPDPVPPAYLEAAQALWARPGQLQAIAADTVNVGPAMIAMSSRYPGIQVPVTIVTGDTDRLVDPDQHAYPLHQAIPGSQLIVLPRTGHEIPHNRPQQTLDAVRQTWERAPAHSPAPAPARAA